MRRIPADAVLPLDGGLLQWRTMKWMIRRRVQAVLKRLSPEAIARKSRAVADNVESLEAFRSARTVLLYLPIPGEVDVSPVARAAWRDGKRVLAPTVCDHCRAMRAIVCCPLHEEMFHPHQGLRQPNRDLGEVPVDQIDLVIVPAVAYDPHGNRLGRGGGFYDRFLARQDMRATTVGVAFQEQIVSHLPVHADDRSVQIVVTDQNIYLPNVR